MKAVWQARDADAATTKTPHDVIVLKRMHAMTLTNQWLLVIVTLLSTITRTALTFRLKCKSFLYLLADAYIYRSDTDVTHESIDLHYSLNMTDTDTHNKQCGRRVWPTRYAPARL